MRRQSPMALISAACIFAGLAQSARAAPVGSCAIQDLMPAYFAFEDQTRSLSPSRRADLFVTQFAPSHPEFFAREAFGDKEKLRKKSLRLLDPSTPEQFSGFPPLTNGRLHAVAAAAIFQFNQAEAKLKTTFTDFGCDASVGFGPSFLSFDGHGYEGVDGHQYMLFGVDTIAALQGPKDMPTFFSHEAFHVYHEHVLSAQIPKDDAVVWWALWEEGLATYVSQRLNPGLTSHQVLWFPADMVAQMETAGLFARAAGLLLRDFDKAGEAHAHWFTGGNAVPGLPARAGCYMGYRLAASLGKDHSLAWLAHLPPGQVKQCANAFLEASAKNASAQ
jgi:hypothetical protein